MQRLQAFRFELMPTGDQARKMRQFAGACRFVYNKALALQKENHEAGGKCRTCPCCSHISVENRKTQALFVCVQCGYKNNADHVGAINILERGQRLLACGELVQSGRSKKQEPTEATQALAA